MFRGISQQLMVLTGTHISHPSTEELFSELCLEVIMKLFSVTQYQSHGFANRHISLQRAMGAFHEFRQDVASMKFNPRNSSPRIFLCDSKLKTHESEFICSVWNISLTNRLRLREGPQEEHRFAVPPMKRFFLLFSIFLIFKDFLTFFWSKAL